MLWSIGIGRGKAQKFGNLFLVSEVLCRTFFQYLAKGVPELLILLGLSRCHFLQHIQYSLGHSALHGFDIAVLLQDFT